MSGRILKRSRGGCINCKRKKKKCDEIKPICSGCLKSNKACQYRIKYDGIQQVHKKYHSKGEEIKSIDHISKKDVGETVWEVVNANWHLDRGFEYGINLDDELFDLQCFMNEELIGHPTDALISLPVRLDEKELSYLEYFCKDVLPEASKLPENANFCSNVYIHMAFKHESVLYSLIAWGCRAMKNQGLSYQIENLEAEEYVGKVQTMVSVCNENLTHESFMANMCCYMLLVCMKISFGDINEWPVYFTQCFNMINKMPGNLNYLKESCSIEGNEVAESFAYYDVLASQSNENGTFYSINEYKDLFNADIASKSLYQGCLKPIILLIGEIVSLRVEYNSLRASFDLPECDKFEVLSTMMERANDLDRQIQFTRLDKGYLKRIRSQEDEEAIEQYLTLFELYQLSAQIYVRQVIKKLPPKVPEMEVLFFSLKQDLEILIENKSLRNIMGFPMLIAGVSAVSKQDREDVKKFFLSLIQSCGYMSGYQKLWIVIQKIWEVNNNGSLCVDWFKITKSMGWRLNLGR